MTYPNRRRKDGKPKPREIRCKSGRNVVDADAMVVRVVGPGAVASGINGGSDMKSIGIMLEQISGLSGTKDVSSWESSFIDSCFEKYDKAGRNSSVLSDKQVEIIDSIFKKHFA